SKVDKQMIRTDLTTDRPLYILSAYAPTKSLAEQLFGGQPREQSFEELRFRHYELSAQGNAAQAIQEAQMLNSNAEEQIKTALADLDGAVKYLTDAEDKHPNRIDICDARGGDVSQPQASSGVFARSGASTPASTFGQPAFGNPQVSAPATAFGQPAFGQAAAPTPAFGKPSAPASGFAQPSFGQSAVKPAFGQPSAPASAFGQPAFGQPALPAPAFGQSASLGGAPSAFQQPPSSGLAPTFGQNTSPAPFGQAQQAGNFSGIQQPQTQSGFGQQSTPFGQQASTGPQSSGLFGQQQSSVAPTPFAAPKPSTGFSQPATTPSNPPMQSVAPQSSNTIGQAPATQTSISSGQTSKPQPPSNPFALANPSQNTAAFGQNLTSAAPASGQVAVQAPTGGLGASARTDAANEASRAAMESSRNPIDKTFGPGDPGARKLLSWQGQKVTYIDNEPCIKNIQDGGWQKIWFPEGQPVLTDNTPQYPEGFTPTDAMRNDWEHFLQHGVGPDGLFPSLPPPRDMIKWDF
ncbi:MAG: hypothetical protein Q9183_004297, partial [Haloplaca sp. 2 TL-2023]